ncbi:hypothetical protein BKA82DRAFT_899513 [Pisolithus tinctorius]|uniref:Uncharacterized protein n=1 Tax=Pisolithus tinctorius Marx 270 TaxID=870435 RepID=A0A0C3PP71_PISTI|nr:hypothetical protein BKA82DRAFT_899513 [Pisolithus tinctorius]KIO10244.1 hypothetical protein M404DRAFT_899513 [Pisolithus tinctorius Marx 270]
MLPIRPPCVANLLVLGGTARGCFISLKKAIQIHDFPLTRLRPMVVERLESWTLLESGMSYSRSHLKESDELIYWGTTSRMGEIGGF